MSLFATILQNEWVKMGLAGYVVEKTFSKSMEIPIFSKVNFMDYLLENGFVFIRNEVLAKEYSCFKPQMDYFFQQTREQKILLKSEGSQFKLKASRGFIDKEALNPTLGYDLKESFDFGFSLSNFAFNIIGENKWPEISNFKDDALSILKGANIFAMELLHAIGVHLDVKEELIHLFEDPISIMRLLNYKKQNVEETMSAMGAGSHVDYGGLTVVYQFQEGVEVLKDNEWLSLPLVPGTFVVFSGFLLHRLTNKVVSCSPHRVINRNNLERQSIAYFLDPNPTTKIETIMKLKGKKDYFPGECLSGHKGLLQSSFQE